MRSLEPQRHGKRGIEIALEKFNGVVGRYVVHPAFALGQHAIDQERTVIVAAMASEAGGIIKARTFLLVGHVPFPDVSVGVAHLFKAGGPGRIFNGEMRSVVGNAIEVTVAAG